MPHPAVSGEAWALASGVLWAVGVVLFARAGESISPLPLNLFKDVVSLAFLVPLLLLAPGWLPGWGPRAWLLVAVSGVLGITLADTLFFVALNRLGAGLNAIVDCLYYPAMVVVAFTVIHQPVALRDLGGGALVMSGVLVAALGHPPGGRTGRDLAVGVAAGGLGMVLVAMGVALIEDILETEPVLAVTTYRLLFGTLALLPLNLASRTLRGEVRRLALPGPLWRHALPAAVTGGALAMWAWLAGFAAADVSRAAVMNQMSTIWIYVLAVALLGERLTRRRVAALALGFGGALLVMTG